MTKDSTKTTAAVRGPLSEWRGFPLWGERKGTSLQPDAVWVFWIRDNRCWHTFSMGGCDQGLSVARGETGC